MSFQRVFGAQGKKKECDSHSILVVSLSRDRTGNVPLRHLLFYDAKRHQEHFAAHQPWLFRLRSLWVRAASAALQAEKGSFLIPFLLEHDKILMPLNHPQKEDLRNALQVYFLVMSS